VEKQKIGVIIILAFFGIFFWVAFEQAGVSLTFLAEQHVDRVVTSLNFVIPTAWFQSVNPLAIPIGSYTSFFMIFVVMSIIAAIILLLIKKKLETMMQGIK
jgi:dipeptide/tripeptide permease